MGDTNSDQALRDTIAKMLQKTKTEFEYVEFLGKGSYGSVHLVKQGDGSFPLYAAVKTAKSEQCGSLKREIETLAKLKGCKRIVQCYGDHTLEEDFDSNGLRVYKMVLEYASGGSLKSFMEDKRLSDTMIKGFTRMILQGLVSVHSLGYVHCDLKPDNLLVFPCRQTSSYKLKISDFGSSKKVGECEDCCNSFMGTPIYMSPESVRDGVAEKALDLWSLGCIVLEMYAGVCPWLGIGYDELEKLLWYGNAPEIPESVPSDARMFIERCFARNPEERGTASDLLLHPFLRREQKMEDTIISGFSLPPLKLKTKRAPSVYSTKRAAIKSKPPQFKNHHLKLKILPPKQPAFSFIPVQ